MSLVCGNLLNRTGEDLEIPQNQSKLKKLNPVDIEIRMDLGRDLEENAVQGNMWMRALSTRQRQEKSLFFNDVNASFVSFVRPMLKFLRVIPGLDNLNMPAAERKPLSRKTNGGDYYGPFLHTCPISKLFLPKCEEFQ